MPQLLLQPWILPGGRHSRSRQIEDLCSPDCLSFRRGSCQEVSCQCRRGSGQKISVGGDVHCLRHGSPIIRLRCLQCLRLDQLDHFLKVSVPFPACHEHAQVQGGVTRCGSDYASSGPPYEGIHGTDHLLSQMMGPARASHFQGEV